MLSIGNLASKIFGSSNDRRVKQFRPKVAEINALEDEIAKLTDDELKALHMQIHQVCKTAVDVNADDTKFPENWLFKHRWVHSFFPLRLL